MKKFVILFVCFVSNIQICSAQKQDSCCEQQLFSKGIYLENLHILIPWEVKFSELEKYGNPKILKDSSNWFRTPVRWDSVKILNGFLVTIETSIPKIFFKQDKINRISQLTSKIDSTTSKNMISFFTNYTHSPGFFKQKRKETYYNRWFIDRCFVYVGHTKNYGYYFHIENMAKRRQN